MDEIDFSCATLTPAAQKFIATFVRFEYALKQCQFCQESGRAQVDWNLVTTKLGEKFYEEIVASNQAPTILNRPPKRQISNSRSLEWAQVNPPTNVIQLLEAVRRVRNNQFHGGKSGHPDDSSDDITRREKLISEAQWIVEQVLRHLLGVRYEFEGRY